MRLETTALRSKIGQRIFLFFVASALVPVLIFSLLSLGQVNTLLNEQVARQLHATSKNYGMLLYDRLLFLEAEIMELAELLNKQPGERERLDKHLNERFTEFSITRIGDGRITLPGSRTRVSLDIAQIQHLSQGKTVLLNWSSINSPPRVFLIRDLDGHHSEGALLIGEIGLNYLWGDEGLLEPAITLCVLESSNKPIYCTDQRTAWISTSLKAKLTEPSSGSFYWTMNGKESIVNYWSIFTQPQFLTSHWTVITTQPAAEVWASVAEFLHIYSFVFVLTVLTVVLLSIHTIRKSLLPLEELMGGMRRIGGGDFTRPVVVRSNDEFQALAVCCNQMSTQLSKQIKTLRTMAEIDHLILTRFKMEDILEIVLNRLEELVPCDLVGMILMEDDSHGAAQLHARLDQSSNRILSTTVKLTDRETKALVDNPRCLSLRVDETLTSYLIPLSRMGARSFIVLPILIEKKLSAVICIGYRQFSVIPDTDATLARDFADRIAVGLSKAAWEEQLYYQAHYDVLTHLPNRLLVNDRLQQALSRARRCATYTAVLFLDVDRFKTINDSLGHKAGDLLLTELAQRLLQATRRSDTVARLSGDEFIVVIPDINDNRHLLATTIAVAEKILTQMAEPFELMGHTVRTTASIGIALYPRDGDNLDDLLKNADVAMYHAKSRGRNNYQFYAKDLNATAIARLRMENQLHQALEAGEFELHYQPQWDIPSGRIVGAEALLRWRHPLEGWIPPAEFIPVAEETGLILPIGEWVLRTACKQVKALHGQGFTVDVSVNISALQFRQPHLVKMIRQALESTGLEPHRLEIEVTESATMQDLEESLALLTQMRELGLRIAIDDFGTGYSSLVYLKRFPVHTLKIDRAFIRNLGTSPPDAAIVKSIVVLAKNLGLGVVAEGVETDEQLEYLRRQGCEKFQGYLCSPPLPLDDFLALLIKNQSRAALLDG
jgi:diguanylate cyclase (GGDEF)-like protein